MTSSIVALILSFFAILYEIYSGEIISNSRYGKKPPSKQAEPAKFWRRILLHLLIWVSLLIGVVLYQLGILPTK